jgi:hypothetical protein
MSNYRLPAQEILRDSSLHLIEDVWSTEVDKVRVTF